MLKKVLTAIALGAVVCLPSCGKEITVATNGDELSSEAVSTESAETTASQSVEEAQVMNYTAPLAGEQIVIINIKDHGEVKIKLFPEYAEKGVENFTELAKRDYYDGLIFHRVIKDFMIQGGDPLGTGTGGASIWGDKFEGGSDPHLIHVPGAVAYANSGVTLDNPSPTASNGSQFYIVTGDVYTSEDLGMMSSYYQIEFTDEASSLYTSVGGAPWLDGGYTVFGQVFDGLDIIFELQNVSTDASNNKPLEDIVIESVEVSEYNGEDIRWFISDYE